MKNYVKAIVTFIFLMAVAVFVPSTSEAALSAPANLKQTGASTSSVEFTWDTVIEADDYYTSISNDGVSNWSTPTRVFGSKESFLNLRAGSTYYVKVYAVDKDKNKSPESAVLEVVTAPDQNGITKVDTQVTNNSIKFSWTPADGTTSYDITAESSNSAPILNTAETTATIQNLQPATWYGYYVTPCRVAVSTGYKAAGGSVYLVYAKTMANPPVKPSLLNFGITSVNAAGGTATFAVPNLSTMADGYELEVRNLKGKVVKKITSMYSYSAITTFAKNKPYKYRVRLYVTNGTTKLYGAWSGYRYFWLSNVTGKKVYSLRSSYAKIKLHWAKVSGAKGYNISMSSAKDGKYKKVKTLSKKAKGVTLTKFGKKKLNKYKTYYIKVTAKIKVGKKTVANDAQIVNYNY